MMKFAVFGNPIIQSISPDIHQHFAEQAGLTINYIKLLSHAESFHDDLRAFFNESDVVGCNVTAPFKESAFSFAHTLHNSARDAGAANTLHRAGGHIEAHNTDGAGLVSDIERLIGNIQGARVLLLGAGGAARGVIRPLIQAGIAHLTVANRTVTKAHNLVERAKTFSSSIKTDAVPLANLTNGFDIVINSTSASLSNDIPDLGDLSFTHTSLTYDMSYKAEPTAFLALARERGSAKCADGLGMLIGQAAVAFTIWTGFTPRTESLIQTLRLNMSA